MVIAQLTHLRIAIPSSGNPPGEVPSDCFPRMEENGMTKTPKRVTFAPVLHTSTGEIDPPTTDQDETPTESLIVTKRKKQRNRWPRADWDDIGDATLDPGLEFVASWSARIMEERSSPPLLIPLSAITAEDSQDSIMVQIGSSISELYTPAGLDRIRSENRRRPRRPMNMSTKCEKPAPAKDFLFRDILCDPPTNTNRSLSESTGNKDSSSPGKRLCFPTYDLQCGGPRTLLRRVDWVSR